MDFDDAITHLCITDQNYIAELRRIFDLIDQHDISIEEKNKIKRRVVIMCEDSSNALQLIETIGLCENMM